jgi:hypothetical protein
MTNKLKDLVQRVREEAIVTFEHGGPDIGVDSEGGYSVSAATFGPLFKILPKYKTLFQDKKLKDALIYPKKGNPRDLFPSTVFVVRYSLDLDRLHKNISFLGEKHTDSMRKSLEGFVDPTAIMVFITPYVITAEREFTGELLDYFGENPENVFNFTRATLEEGQHSYVNKLRERSREVSIYDLTKGLFRGSKQELVLPEL